MPRKQQLQPKNLTRKLYSIIIYFNKHQILLKAIMMRITKNKIINVYSIEQQNHKVLQPKLTKNFILNFKNLRFTGSNELQF